MRFKALLLGLALLTLALFPVFAATDETLAEHRLKQIAERQRTVFAEAVKAGKELDQPEFKARVEQIGHEYESLLRDNPNFAEAYAGYGYLLWKAGMHKEAAALFLKADAIDSSIALVKNELGNYEAEEGRPLEASAYFLSAINLEPKEPLYHYQLGVLLYEARDDFLKSGEWNKDALEHSMHQAFRNAAELAPDRIEFTYRYAESFYDLSEPNWEEALKAWEKLEANAPSSFDRQTLRLHQANIRIKQGLYDRATQILATITDERLQEQKKKLIALLPAPPAK